MTFKTLLDKLLPRPRPAATWSMVRTHDIMASPDRRYMHIGICAEKPQRVIMRFDRHLEPLDIMFDRDAVPQLIEALRRVQADVEMISRDQETTDER